MGLKIMIEYLHDKLESYDKWLENSIWMILNKEVIELQKEQ